MNTVSEIKIKSGVASATISMSTKEKQKKNVIIIVLIILLIASVLFSFTIGRYRVPLSQLMEIFIGKLFGLKASWPITVETVLFKVRIPRIAVALMIGAALSTSGATYQGLFKNPMVSPDILGASAGAGFGAAMAILMSFGSVGIQVSAFLFALLAVALTYTVGSVIGRGNSSVLALVLTGMVISTLFSSFISITKYVADTDNKLPAITFWLMGGLSSVNMRDVKVLFIPLIIGMVPLFLIRWKLNVLSFGEEEAQAMGIDTRKIRMIVIICSTILTASAVSVSGMIGWVGLIIPHIARMLVGPNYKNLLPTSILIGSIFLLLVDDVARTTFAMEIPLGILTSLIGAPLFIYMMLKGKKGWI